MVTINQRADLSAHNDASPTPAAHIDRRLLHACCDSELRFSSVTPLLSSFLPSLRSINLSFNRLERVPDMGTLPHLTALNLQGNAIAHVEHLARCPLLESLDLAINQVDNLPSLCSELMSVTQVLCDSECTRVAQTGVR